MRRLGALMIVMLSVVVARDVNAEGPSTCAIAARPFTPIETSSLASDLKDRLRSYRKGWQAVCARTPGRPSLESLLGQAMALYDATDTKENIQGLTPVLDYDSRLIPAMGPGMGDPLYPYEDEFVAMAMTHGTGTDRFFWKRYPVASSVLSKPPWILGTWDYGGCPRYGEYDWVKGVTALEELKGARLGPTYRKLAQDAEREIWNQLEWFSESSEACTCGPVSAVATDLERILQVVRERPSLRRHSAPLQARIRAIKSGAVTVRSYAEGYCQGG